MIFELNISKFMTFKINFFMIDIVFDLDCRLKVKSLSIYKISTIYFKGLVKFLMSQILIIIQKIVCLVNLN